MSTAQQSDTVHAPAAGSGVELPDYAASQRAALKAEREAMYREYEAATLAAETGYVGSNGTFRIPPNNMVSGVLKMGFYVKHKVVTKAKRKKSIVTTDVTTEESTLVPGYEHVGEENGSPVSNDTTGAPFSGRALAKRDVGKEIVLSVPTVAGGVEHDFYYIQDDNGCMHKTDIHVNTLIINEVDAPLNFDAPYSCSIDITKDGLQTMPAGMWFSSTTDGQDIGTITCGSDAPGTCKILGGGSGDGVSQTCNVNQGDEACGIA